MSRGGSIDGSGVDIVSLTEKNESLVGGLDVRRAGNQPKVKNKDLNPRSKKRFGYLSPAVYERQFYARQVIRRVAA